MEIGNKIKCVLLLVFNSLSLIGVSQDTIVNKDGIKIYSKILEVSSNEVKFKKIETVDGPDYIINKWDVAQIKYGNGSVEYFNIEKPIVIKGIIKPALSDTRVHPEIIKSGKGYIYGGKYLNRKQLYDTLYSLNDPKITEHLNKARKNKPFIPMVLPGGGAIIGGYCVGLLAFFIEAPELLAGGVGVGVIGIGCCVTSMICLHNYKEHENIALMIYEQNYNY